VNASVTGPMAFGIILKGIYGIHFPEDELKVKHFVLFILSTG